MFDPKFYVIVSAYTIKTQVLENTSADVLDIISLEQYIYESKREIWHPLMPEVYHILTQLKNIHPQMNQI